MGKRIIALQNASNITNDTYIPVDSESNGVKKISAGFINDIVTDVTVDNTSVVDNGVAAISLSGKQDVLTPGTNIQIQNNTISATDTTYSNFSGTDGTDAGTSGLVPAPTTSDTDKYLKSDGTWGAIASGGSNVTITPSLSSGTKIADYEIDGVDGELYAPSGGGSGGSTNSYGYATPMDSTGSDGDIYGKIEDVSGEEECIETPISITSTQVPKEIPLPRSIDQYNTIKISIHAKSNGTDRYFNDILVNVSSLGTTSETATRLNRPTDGTYSYVNIYKSEGRLIVSYSDWSICEITSLIGTYTSAHKVTDIYQKVEGHWSKYEKGEYSETVLWDQSDNPTTSSGDFTLSDSVENYDAIVIFGNGAGDIATYQLINTNYIPRGQLRYNVQYLCNASFNSERRPWINFTDSTHITIGLHGRGATILTVVGIKFGGSGGSSEQTPSLYNFYKSNDETIIVRTGPDGTYWFFNGYTLTTSYMTIPEELQMYKPSNTDVILSDAYINASDTTASGWIGFYSNTIRAWNTSKSANITGTFYGVVKIDGASSQTNGYYNAYDGIPNASGTNYSTAEQVIGTWIDGKPLYQKTFTVTSPSDGNFARVVDCSSLNIDTMTDITGFIKTSANITKVSNSSFILWYRTKNNDATPNDCIMCQISNSAYYSSNLYITAQYTKTTD